MNARDMLDSRREKIRGRTYFFTVCAQGRRPSLVSPPLFSAITEAMTGVREELPFSVNAWVLLPDHLHCIWTLPPDDFDLSKRWSKIKRLVTQSCDQLPRTTDRSRFTRNEGGIWQHRCWEHPIQSGDDYRLHMDYIHWNPVKHGYASSAIDWRYTSFHRYVIKGTYEADWGVSEGRFEGRHFGE